MPISATFQVSSCQAQLTHWFRPMLSLGNFDETAGFAGYLDFSGRSADNDWY